MLVHIEHYLDQEGRGYFPQWIEQMADVVSRFPGFVSLRQLHADSGPECHLLLEFESDYQMNEWTNSHEYFEMMEKLEPYRDRPCLIQRFTLGKWFGR